MTNTVAKLGVAPNSALETDAAKSAAPVSFSRSASIGPHPYTIFRGCSQEGPMQEEQHLGFVLIHGGGLETWVWERLIPLLRRPALAARRLPPHTPRHQATLSDCADYIWSQAEDAGFDRMILVAHSIAGVLAPQVALLAPQRVVHMVFVAANIPPEGKTALAAFRAVERWQMALGIRLARWNLTPRKTLEQRIRKHLCNDLDEVAIQHMVQGGTHPEPPALFFERVSRVALPPIPCTYIKLLQDRALPPSIQEAMAADIGAHIVPLDTGHTAMLSRPSLLAQVLNQIADAVAVE